ncbi:Fic family protein [Phytoactinopolyspora halotolerans]|uniref:Fic family protein n=1 Tax=Phytoactinopolyspora halotolerans TaxID=1981512 RepID=A0A6L9S0F3_9ACTN|nr:Fic family protein [Phytoactinopolyspora halotolerans]NED98602.1 Fic family protein [Phytoactinopolyspora halotolerans]
MDRSALAAGPGDGWLFVDHERVRPLGLPGLTVVPRRGPGPLSSDVPLGDGLWLSSEGRALVDNLGPSRSRGARPPRTLSTRELHDWIARLVSARRPEQIERIVEQAKEAADAIGRVHRVGEVRKLIAAADGGATVTTESPALSAAQAGRGYDVVRVSQLEMLADHLTSRPPRPRPVTGEHVARQRFLPFYEAYFSNFIEGTEFTVDEAAMIALQGQDLPSRPADAHDMRGTYELVVDDAEMTRELRSVDEYLDALRERHARIMGGRPDVRPGEWKDRRNQAGATVFVEPALVTGTLAAGREIVGRLDDPFARALYAVYLIGIVHPFDDGNGRLARVMMNNELVAAGECRIIVPTVFRYEYLAALGAMSDGGYPQALISVLDFAQRYTYQIDFSTVGTAHEMLERTHAFTDPQIASEQGIRLTLPSSLPRTEN